MANDQIEIRFQSAMRTTSSGLANGGIIPKGGEGTMVKRGDLHGTSTSTIILCTFGTFACPKRDGTVDAIRQRRR